MSRQHWRIFGLWVLASILVVPVTLVVVYFITRIPPNPTMQTLTITYDVDEHTKHRDYEINGVTCTTWDDGEVSITNMRLTDETTKTFSANDYPDDVYATTIELGDGLSLFSEEPFRRTKNGASFDLKDGMITDSDGNTVTFDATVKGTLRCDQKVDAP